MSKKLRKAVSLLLTIAVLSSGTAMTAMAADDTAPAATQAPAADAAATPAAAAAADAAATQAPAAGATATTAPTTTAAPAPVEELDAYLQESLGLLQALKIVQGYEDGSVKPESNITRAEMATMVLRMMGIEATSPYTNTFTDVTSSHWAANTIQTAFNMGIINGMGDGTFAPDANVTFAQAVKMLVCSLQYEQLAKNMGGYPVGYIAAAAQKNIEITKNVSGIENDTPATRGVVIKMIYNTLNALYPTGTGMTADGMKYTTEEGKTLASELLDVYSVEGIITATHSKSIDSAADPAEGQILIDGEVYLAGEFDADKYVGYKVKAYYHEKDENGVKRILFAVPKTKQTTLVIDGDDIDTIEDIRSDSAKINYFPNKSSSKTKAAKCKSPVVVYNGKIITSADVPGSLSLEEFITPEVGKVTLNDYDNDGYYDVVFIDSYKTYVVTSATEKKINHKYTSYEDPETGKKIDVPALDVDLEGDEELELTITKDGSDVKPKNLKKWDILTVIESANKTGERIMNIEVCSDTIEGKVSDIDFDEDEDEYSVKIDGKEYDVEKVFALSGDIESGTEGTFHLDSLGRIAAVEGAAGSKLSSTEEYGWLVWAKVNSSSQEKEIKMFTKSGAVKTYEIDDKLTFYGPDKSDVYETLKKQVEEGRKWKNDWTLDDLKDVDWSESKVLEVENDDDWNELLMAEDVIEYALASDAYQMKLVKFETNSKGKIKSLAMPVLTDNYKYEDDNRPVILNINMDGVDGGGSLLDNKYNLSSTEITQIVAPEKLDNVNDTDTYKYETVAGSQYIAREGVSVTYFLAEFDGLKPTLIIKYIGASSEPSDYNYNSADDTQTMMISKIQNVYDDDEEEEVYKITGYVNGNKVTYTTDKTTAIGACNATGGAPGDTRKYAYSKLWSAVNSEYDGSGDEPQYKDIHDALNVGDIVGVKANGTKVNTLLKFVDSKKAEEFDFGAMTSTFTCLTAGDLNGRDGFAAGKIEDTDTDELLTISLKDGSNVAVDPGFYVDIYNTKTGKVEEGELVSNLDPYDEEDGTGDILVARIYRMNVREVFAIRFE